MIDIDIHIQIFEYVRRSEIDKMWDDLQAFKADFFKALAHPLRIRILELLADGQKVSMKYKPS